jgi:hypothetical protein
VRLGTRRRNGVVLRFGLLAVALLVAGCAGRKPADLEPGGVEATNLHVLVVKEYANLRMADSGRSGILKRLPRGAEVLVLTKSGKWYQVLEEETNALGWVHQTYVREVMR